MPHSPPTAASPNVKVVQARFATARGRTPLLVRGLLPPDAVAAWRDSDKLRSALQQLNDGEVSVMLSADNEHFLDHDRFVDRRTVSVEYLLHRILEQDTVNREDSNPPPPQYPQISDRIYFRDKVPASLHSSLHMDDVIRPAFLSDQTDRVNPDLVRMWCSSPGSVTPLHYDKCHGLIVQLVGSKYFMQLPDHAPSSVYPSDGTNAPTHASRVRHATKAFGINPATGTPFETDDMPEQMRDTVQWTRKTFPQLLREDPCGVLLQPGDVLYTPSGCYHEVTSVTGSVSVTIPWDMSPQELASGMGSHMNF
ncbi:hypothetical protein RI367_004575 [Sorochytrium milnesiophthora]